MNAARQLAQLLERLGQLVGSLSEQPLCLLG
jgi:hypothetical protein